MTLDIHVSVNVMTCDLKSERSFDRSISAVCSVEEIVELVNCQESLLLALFDHVFFGVIRTHREMQNQAGRKKNSFA